MHKVPVHLDTQDTFLWSFTFRQVLVLFVGGGFAYLIGTADWSTLLAALLCVLAGSLCMGVTILVAFVQVQHRDLDQWGLLVLIFYSSPRIYHWSALTEELDTIGEHEQALEDQGEEEW